MDKITSGVTICMYMEKVEITKFLDKTGCTIHNLLRLLLWVLYCMACARYGNFTLFTFSLNQSAHLFISNLRFSLDATFVSLLHSNKNEHIVAVNLFFTAT
jgi:hypothetical protein